VLTSFIAVTLVRCFCQITL